MRMRHRRAKPRCEALEARLVLNAPSPYPGTPIELPQDGAWRNSVFNGSPIVADLDGDGRDEVITPAVGGRLIAYTTGSDGIFREFRRYETGSEANFKATPIVIERPGASPMIVAGLGRDEAIPPVPGPIEDGRVFAFDALTGAVLPGWPVGTGRNNAGQSGVVGPIASGDLDGDGVPEIVVTSFSHLVTAFRLDGTILWRFNNDDTVVSGAAIADLDRDGRPEVVFGGDTSPNGFFHAGGFVNVLTNTGSAKFRIPVGEVIWSSPALADLDGDGMLEIVVGTGLNYARVSPSTARLGPGVG